MVGIINMGMPGSIRLGVCGLALALGGLAVAPAQAGVVVLDQTNPAVVGRSAVLATFGFLFPANPTLQIGYVQSFTAGRSGYLDHLDFELLDFGAAGTLTLSLYAGDFATGSPSLLLSSTLDTSQIADTLSVPLPLSRFDVRAADFLVAAGTRYSVTFDYRPATGTGVMYLAHSYFGTTPGGPPAQLGSDYSGGTLSARRSAAPMGSAGTVIDGDVGFRSYVEEITAPVPEPASWAMMIAGLGLAGGALRARPARRRVRFA